MEPKNLINQAEAFLFVEGGALPLRRLGQLLGISVDESKKVVQELSTQLYGRGIVLVQTETEVSLVVAPSAAPAVLQSYERELGREVGDAGLEVISIVLYRGPSTRAEIDYIRGVGTSSTIRTLLSRGLLERTENPKDGREYLYRPTVELLTHLGVTKGEELPEYAKITHELAAYERKTDIFKQHNGGNTDTAGD